MAFEYLQRDLDTNGHRILNLQAPIAASEPIRKADLTFTQGSILFAGATGLPAQDNANVFYDAATHRVGIGTNLPAFDLDVTRSTNGPLLVQAANPNAGNAADSGFHANNGTAGSVYGMTGTGFVAGGPLPNLGASTAFVNSGTSLYLGATVDITFQTGATQVEHLRILANGEVRVPALSAGGMVKAGGSGQLELGIAGTDFLVPAGALTQGSILFADGSGRVAQDNPDLFFDSSLVAVGVGTHPHNTNAVFHARKDQDGFSNLTIENQSAGTHAGSAMLAVNGFASNQSFLSAGIVGASFAAASPDPNLGAGTGFILTGGNGTSTQGLYVGVPTFITLQTGPVRAERLRIDVAGSITIPGLNAGGLVKAAAFTGQLGLAVPGTDFLAPTSTLTPGSILFAGVGGAVSQDNASFFYDPISHRMGLGNTTPSSAIDVEEGVGGGGAYATIQARSLSTAVGAGGQGLLGARFSASNGTAIAFVGIQGVNAASPSSIEPNLAAGMAYLLNRGPSIGVPSNGLYIGATGPITFQTAAASSTESERLRILPTGEVQVVSLAASGIVKATTTNGQLALAVPGVDYLAPTGVLTNGSILFAAGGAISQDNARLFWDATNHFVGFGTNTPSRDLDVVRSSTTGTIVGITNVNASTTASAFLLVQNGSSTLTAGITGTGFVSTGSLPNLGPSTGFVNAERLYVGSPNFITFQTGTPELERLHIDVAGLISMSSLAAGGVVHSTLTSGQLTVGQVTTADIANLNVTLGKIAAIAPGTILGNDGVSAQSPLALAVTGPLTIATGSGHLTFATGFATGSVVFMGASQIAEDHANFFYDAATHRAGFGTITPTAHVHVSHTGGVASMQVTNVGTSFSDIASMIVDNGSASGAMSMNGTVHPGGGSLPNAGPNTFVLSTSLPGPTPLLYLGSHGDITLQTGSTQAERMRILVTGEIGMGTSVPLANLDVHNDVAGANQIRSANASTSTTARAQFWATNNSRGLIAGVTGTAYTAVGTLPNLGASTAYLATSGALGANLYIGADTDITFQTGATQAERLRILATGEVVVLNKIVGGTTAATTLVLQGTTDVAHRGSVMSNDPFGIGRSPGVLGGAPMFAVAGSVAVNSSAGASLDYVVVSTSTVNISGSTAITNAGGFNWVTIQAPVYSGTVAIGAGGFSPPAATVCIEGAPTVAGGASFNNGASLGPLGLWVKASVEIDGSIALGSNLTMNGTLTVGSGNVAITSGTVTIAAGDLHVPSGIIFADLVQVTTQLFMGPGSNLVPVGRRHPGRRRSGDPRHRRRQRPDLRGVLALDQGAAVRLGRIHPELPVRLAHR